MHLVLQTHSVSVVFGENQLPIEEQLSQAMTKEQNLLSQLAEKIANRHKTNSTDYIVREHQKIRDTEVKETY